MAQSAEDVAQGVNFAREHNLRLVVKGPGHSYLGCSSAPDSLMIWTRAMNDVMVHDAFRPLGGQETGPAVSVGGGAIWIDVYHAVSVEAGRYAQGGACTDVGVAGLLQGGGFGSLSKTFGVAGASLIEAEVVTADGWIRIVNAHRDPDLFWALKGGGGGNFAVVTRVTLRTHDLPETFGALNVTLKAQSDEAFRALLEQFLAVYAANLMNPHWGEQAHVQGNNTLDVSMLSQGMDETEMRAAWRPLLDWVADPSTRRHHHLAVHRDPDPGSRAYWDLRRRADLGLQDVIFDSRAGAPAWRGWWRRDAAQAGVYLHGFDSLWLPRQLLDPAQRPALVDALFDASRAHQVSLYFNKGLAGGAARAIRRRTPSTPMNPDVLDAFALAAPMVFDGGPPATFPARHSGRLTPLWRKRMPTRSTGRCGGCGKPRRALAAMSRRAVSSMRPGARITGANIIPGFGASRPATTRPTSFSHTTAWARRIGARTGSPAGSSRRARARRRGRAGGGEHAAGPAPEGPFADGRIRGSADVLRRLQRKNNFPEVGPGLHGLEGVAR